MRVIERIRNQLQAVGIRARLVPTSSWNDYIARTTRGDYDIAVLGWQADSLDPNDFLAALLGSESIGATNRSYRLRDGRAAEARPHGAARRAGRRLQGGPPFQRDTPIVPLYHGSVTAYRKTLGPADRPTGVLRFDKA
jgi:dipeptide transport system substrate-binding protein